MSSGRFSLQFIIDFFNSKLLIGGALSWFRDASSYKLEPSQKFRFWDLFVFQFFILSGKTLKLLTKLQK